MSEDVAGGGDLKSRSFVISSQDVETGLSSTPARVPVSCPDVSSRSYVWDTSFADVFGGSQESYVEAVP